MRYKLSIGILVVLVCGIMLMSNTMAGSGWPVTWANQQTLSNNPHDSQDPENSGFVANQVTVWEEFNGGDWDIMMSYSITDGAGWIPSPFPPAATSDDEINPAVAMSRPHPSTGAEVHVVYQLLNPSTGNNEIYHTWTLNFGLIWFPPVLLSNPSCDTKDPAIVYTEDLWLPGPGIPSMLVQMVWAEEIYPPTGVYQIQYDAFYWMGRLAPPRGYISTALGGPITIRTPPPGFSCNKPEIASVDENSPARMLAADFDFSVVWEEQDTGTGLRSIWYHDGTTQVWPFFANVLNPGGAGRISLILNPSTDDCYDPDIAATQDYVFGVETYYFHVNWVYLDNLNSRISIESCYAVGPVTLPGPVFVYPGSIHGPTTKTLDRPTIASKLNVNGLFETWMAWEDHTDINDNNPSIWFIAGTCNIGIPFSIGAGPTRVTYTPGKGKGTHEGNPELWNRNDAIRLFPPLTHLVFDQDDGTGSPKHVEYIDP